MLVVETIGRIRREHLGKGKSIKEIARTLHLSRNTVRRILRSGETAFSYDREVQPRPKLGAVDGRTRSASVGERESRGARAADADPHLRGVAASRLRGRLRRCSALCAALGRAARGRDGGRLHSPDVRAGRSLPVRLEPRDRRHGRRDDDGEGRPRPALPQPHDVRARLSAREPGDGVRRARARLRVLPWRLPARDLRQHEDGGGHGLRRQGPPVQPPLPPDVLAPPRRASRLHAGRGLGERPGREPGRPGARALLHAAAEGQELRRVERLACRQMCRLGQGARSPRAEREDDLGGRSRTSVRSSFLIASASTDSTRCRPRCRRPASCGSTTTAIR